jgi:hypothetical protein
MIDPSGWDDALVEANISKFIEERVL